MGDSKARPEGSVKQISPMKEGAALILPKKKANVQPFYLQPCLFRHEHRENDQVLLWAAGLSVF